MKKSYQSIMVKETVKQRFQKLRKRADFFTANESEFTNKLLDVYEKSVSGKQSENARTQFPDVMNVTNSRLQNQTEVTKS